MLLFEQMREQGWDPQLCDTPVPYYDGRVPCGCPSEAADEVDGYMMLPRNVAEINPVYTLSVRGDSMRDADISSGDTLEVLATSVANDGDIVVASVDGAYTVKVFVTDEQGRPWLVPRNSDYRPIQLTAESDAHILGRVVSIRKPTPRVSYNTLIREVHKEVARIYREESAPVAQDDVLDRLPRLLYEAFDGNMVSARDWAAVYRVLVDRCQAPSAYVSFAAWANGLSVEGFPLCTADSVRKADAVYQRPLSEWKLGRVSSARLSMFERRKAIALWLDGQLQPKGSSR